MTTLCRKDARSCRRSNTGYAHAAPPTASGRGCVVTYCQGGGCATASLQDGESEAGTKVKAG